MNIFLTLLASIELSALCYVLAMVYAMLGLSEMKIAVLVGSLGVVGTIIIWGTK